MVIEEMKEKEQLSALIREQLKPLVKKIDSDAYYPYDFLTALCKAGFLTSHLCEEEVLLREVRLVEETAKTCMTSAFNLWCHLAALTYVRKSNNRFLKRDILPALENGTYLGGTGLSNPMKYYAGLESLHLKATRTNGGYTLSGVLPSVSNLKSDHWFGIVASVSDEQRIMAFVPCFAEGLTLKAKIHFMGVNGSATYACAFHDVYVSDDWIISEEADQFVERIRPIFLLYQIPLGLGVIDASIQSIQKMRNKQGGCNQYLNTQSDELTAELHPLREKVYELTSAIDLSKRWGEIVKARLQVTYLAIKAVHASMLHYGGAGYIQKSDPSRRLRESYFLANLTPSVKHLEKIIQTIS